MARTQAAEYEARRYDIRKAAATLFAKKGFLGTSVADLSAACNISKSLIYHYFPSKEDILFEVMWEHVSTLVELARGMSGFKRTPEEMVGLYAVMLLSVYNGAQAQQKILLNELDNLPPDKRALVVNAEREVMAVVDNWLVEMRPWLKSQPKQRRPIVMMFFGMLNWTHIWFDPDGPVSMKKVAGLVTDMFLGGLPRRE